LSSPEYAELECFTNYSFLRGASHPEELVERAANIGLKAIALTDRDGVYGIPKAYWESRKTPQLKLITGASLSLPNGKRLTLLASDRSAYGLLCRILTASHADKEKGLAEVSWASLQEILDTFSGRNSLIALANADSDLLRVRSLFPQAYLTISRWIDGLDRERTEKALWLSRRFNLPLVATNQVRYHCPKRRDLQDTLTSIRIGTPLSKLGHDLFSNSERYLKSAEEMHLLFEDLPEALKETLQIAERCTFSPSELRYRYPTEWIPAGKTAQSYLEDLTWEGAKSRYDNEIPSAVTRQLQHELALIRQLNFADYFLTIYDIVIFARKKDILCQGRGSAANSAVCFCLGITAIDPVRMNLLFERFLSLERNEPPDIDVDFEHERREEVIQYVYEKYGRDRAAMLSAVVTYRKRSAFREVSKALGVDVGSISARKLEKDFANRIKEADAKNIETHVTRLSTELSGFPRHLSIHSGGFTLSADPLLEIVPIEPARMEGRTIIQWDKYDLDYLGLLKVDLLSLGMLSALHRTLKTVGMALHEIPAEDPDTYSMIQRAETVGTFQIESRAQMSMLGRLQPRTFYDLVIEVAIVRPGPIVGKMVHPYLRRRRGEEPVRFPHPKLKEILGKTLGVPLFQEQVMKMAIELGGFTPGEADDLRRAIGSWRSEGSLQRIGHRLIRGLRQSGLSQEYAEQVFLQIQGFAQYGFPESHAASFALLAYASCYLKCHHPVAFTCGLLNSQPMGFYATHTLVDELKRQGGIVLAIHPNFSEWESIVNEKGDLQLGWNQVKGLGESVGLQIVQKRPYKNLSDFLRKNPDLSRDVLVRIAMGGTFSPFGFSAREALWQVLQYHRRKTSIQGDLFQGEQYLGSEESKAEFSELTKWGSIREEYEAFSLSTTGHPMSALRGLLPLPKLHTKSAKLQSNGSSITVAGLILVRQRPPTASGMTFSTLEDEYGFLDIAIPPDVWLRVKEVFLDHCFLVAQGKLQKEGYSYSLFVSQLKPLWKEETAPEAKNIFIDPVQYFH
jgi:error-prone DNA polymerase